MTLRVYAHAVESADVALGARLGQVLDGRLPGTVSLAAEDLTCRRTTNSPESQERMRRTYP